MKTVRWSTPDARVIDGDGYLPSGAVWAEPDLAHAARLMQRMVADEAWRSGLIDAGRAAMEAQPSLAEAGRPSTVRETARRGGTR
ncbi:MAG: hypothetical protein R2697_07895 [Ilumatobacteraceae bacterium]